MPYINKENQGISKSILFETVSLHSRMIIFIPLKYIKMAGLNGLPLNKLVIQFFFYVFHGIFYFSHQNLTSLTFTIFLTLLFYYNTIYF